MTETNEMQNVIIDEMIAAKRHELRVARFIEDMDAIGAGQMIDLDVYDVSNELIAYEQGLRDAWPVWCYPVSHWLSGSTLNDTDKRPVDPSGNPF